MNNSECDSSDKNDMQKKVNVLVMLQETMQKKKKIKTASYSKPIQIHRIFHWFTLCANAPDKFDKFIVAMFSQ